MKKLLFFAILGIFSPLIGYTHIFQNKIRYGAKVRVDYGDPSCGNCRRTARFSVPMRGTYFLRQTNPCPIYRIEALVDDPRQEFVATEFIDDPFIGNGLWEITNEWASGAEYKINQVGRPRI